MNSVAVIVLDTLRKDSFDDHFEWLPGTRFENAYSTSNWTAPAHASLFTGRYGSEVGVDAKSRQFDPERPALPSVLSSRGYTTRGFSANHNASAQNGFDEGFDEFVNPSTIKNPGRTDAMDWERFLAGTDATGSKLYLEAVLECVRGDHATLPSLKAGIAQKSSRGWFDEQIPDSGASTVLDRVRDTDFGPQEFLFVNLMETHTPYDPPEPFNTVGEGVSVTLRDTFDGVASPDRVEQAYDDSVRYLSDVYERLYAELTNHFDYVVTLADHGEMLGEEGLWNHTYGLYEPVTHIPLVVSKTDGSNRASVDEPVSLLDVHATIAGLAGADVESRGADLRDGVPSTDRLAEYRGLIPYAKQGLRDAGVETGEIERYDEHFSALVGADGGYAIAYEDRVESETLDEETARERLSTVQADVKSRVPTGGEAEPLDAATRDRLEELGYI